MDHPAHYAVELLSRSAHYVTIWLFLKLQLRISLILLTSCIRFQSSATENGVSHAPIQLLHGDFLKNSAVKDAISTAGLVYMNNPKFGPELNLKILGMNFISTRNMLLFTHQTSNVIDSFLTDQLCPLMPKGCKLVLFTPSSSSVQPSPRFFDLSLRFALTAWSGLEAILGKPTATCWFTKSLSKFVIFKKRLRQTFSRHAGWWRCSLVETLRCRFARFRKNLIYSSKWVYWNMCYETYVIVWHNNNNIIIILWQLTTWNFSVVSIYFWWHMFQITCFCPLIQNMRIKACHVNQILT